MNNLISIIVPIYNRAHYIKDIVTTVGNQTYANWKLIFIDDGSTDNTVEEINKVLSEKIELIKLPRHVGVSEARNKGIETAAGDYIAFLDSDDLWEPEKLEKQLKFMEENDYYRLKCLHNQGADIVLRRMDEVQYVGTCCGVVRQ